uniref:PDZ domain-containing protein n=1 Tax=Hanusia phi TaxID=3032 RepID=A0A7S0E6D2_9CRYP
MELEAKKMILHAVVPFGPSYRSGLVKPNMRLIYVDGEFVSKPKEAILERIKLYQGTKHAQVALRLHTFLCPEWKEIKSTNPGLDEKVLASNGFSLSNKGEIFCQCCGTRLPPIPPGESLTRIKELVMPKTCRTRLPPSPPTRTGTLHLLRGFLLGFCEEVPPSVNSKTKNVTNFSRMKYAWIEPGSFEELPKGESGRILIDLNRIILRFTCKEASD